MDYLRVGKIINTHGIKGELKIMPLTSDIKRFDYLEFVFIEINKDFKKYNVDKIRYYKNFVFLLFDGIDNINEAEKLKNKYILVDREHTRELEEDEYFICDLKNCIVYDENNNNLGKIYDIIQTGSNDVYIVSSEGKEDLLIPALKSVVKNIDIEKKRIDVVLPEGLLEDEI